MNNENADEEPKSVSHGDSQPDTAPLLEENPLALFDEPPHWGKLINLLTKTLTLLTKNSYRAGRAPYCEIEIHFPLSEIYPVKFITISKIHFKIERVVSEEGEYIYLEDLSSNGTFINDKIVGKNNRVLLRNAAEISLASPALRMYMLCINNHNDLTEGWFPISMMNRFYILKCLGRGTFGDVRLVMDSNTWSRYAIKKIIKKDNEKRIYNEVNILKKLCNPFIVQLHDIFDFCDAVYITLEYVSGGNLLNRLSRFRKLSEKESKIIFYQILKGVDYLHKEGITHRDLKPENILIESVRGSKYVLAKITDFGLSKEVTDSTALKTICGTFKYMAPEVISSSQTTYDNKVDIWSMGMILYVCLSGHFPFKSQDNDANILKEIMEARFVFYPDDRVSYNAVDIVTGMLHRRPEERVSIADLFIHSWLQDEEMRNEVNVLICKIRGVNSADDSEPVLKKQRTEQTLLRGTS